MIPLVPALVLAFFSFLASAFVILHIIIPILPPHPLSKRVAPAEFGLPNFRSLSLADKAHVWLASLDLVALSVFIWQVVNEATRGTKGITDASDPASSVRLWTALTIRQTILLILVGLTLLHARLGHSVSFGGMHWTLWAPSLVLIVTSTTFAGVFSAAGLRSLFFGLFAYTSTVMVITLITFSSLIGSSFNVKHNLNFVYGESRSVSPVRETSKNLRLSSNIDAPREGDSWISPTSHRDSISTRTISTNCTTSISNNYGGPQARRYHSILARLSYWFDTASHEDIPPVPPLPLPYGQVPPSLSPSSSSLSGHFRPYLGSSTSRLTSIDGSCAISMRDRHNPLISVSRPTTQDSAHVLDGYGIYSNGLGRGVSPSSDASSIVVDIPIIRNLGWVLFILVPYTFSLPYLVTVSYNLPSPTALSIFFVLSVTLSSPILAFNVLLRCSFPIPVGLFDTSGQISPNPSVHEERIAPLECHCEPKQSVSTSVTVVEGRHANDAVDYKGKIGAVVETFNPCPKQSAIPPHDNFNKPPAFPMQHRFSLPVSVHSRSDSAQVDYRKAESKAGSHFSVADGSLGADSRIMVARRHYSVLAQTLIIPGSSPEKKEAQAIGLAAKRTSGHLRSRSVTSVKGLSVPTSTRSFKIGPTPPPPFPLPPTPPSASTARFSTNHKKYFSSCFGIGRSDDLGDIDVGPWSLIPELTASHDIKVKDEGSFVPGVHGTVEGMNIKNLCGFGIDLSLEYFSPPARKPHARKQFGHRRNQCSVRSVALGQGGLRHLSLWSADTGGAFDEVVRSEYPVAPDGAKDAWRNTAYDSKSIFNDVPQLQVQEVPKDNQGADDTQIQPRFTTSSRILRVNLPHEMDPSRFSLLGSTASSVTLFEDIEDDFGTGALAESTPHATVARNKTCQRPSLLTRNCQNATGIHNKSKRCVDKTTNTTPFGEDERSTTVPAMPLLAQWPSQTINFTPKDNVAQYKRFDKSSIITSARANPDKGGLRPLMLLQGRIVDTSAGSVALSGTRSLNLGKKQKAHQAARKNRDENSDPNRLYSFAGSKSPRSLKLARSGTDGMRTIL